MCFLKSVWLSWSWCFRGSAQQCQYFLPWFCCFSDIRGLERPLWGSKIYFATGMVKCVSSTWDFFVAHTCTCVAWHACFCWAVAHYHEVLRWSFCSFVHCSIGRWWHVSVGHPVRARARCRLFLLLFCCCGSSVASQRLRVYLCVLNPVLCSSRAVSRLSTLRQSVSCSSQSRFSVLRLWL